jgi:hypothetical protein
MAVLRSSTLSYVYDFGDYWATVEQSKFVTGFAELFPLTPIGAVTLLLAKSAK